GATVVRRIRGADAGRVVARDATRGAAVARGAVADVRADRPGPGAEVGHLQLRGDAAAEAGQARAVGRGVRRRAALVGVADEDEPRAGAAVAGVERRLEYAVVGRVGVRVRGRRRCRRRAGPAEGLCRAGEVVVDVPHHVAVGRVRVALLVGAVDVVV